MAVVTSCKKVRCVTQNSGNAFNKSIEGLATVIAIVCTILLTPEIDSRTAEWAMRSFVSAYGPDIAGLFRPCWFLIIGAGIFFFARAVLAVGLAMISGWAAMRFGMLPI